jgi:hypothetical protein
MSVKQFEDELRALLRAKPFKPFSVIMEGEETIFVDEPAVAFDGGAASFIDAESEVHFFECEQVREFRLANEELAK